MDVAGDVATGTVEVEPPSSLALSSLCFLLNLISGGVSTRAATVTRGPDCIVGSSGIVSGKGGVSVAADLGLTSMDLLLWLVLGLWELMLPVGSGLEVGDMVSEGVAEGPVS